MKHCQQINFNLQLQHFYKQILIYPFDSIVESRVGIDLNLLLARKKKRFWKNSNLHVYITMDSSN